METPGILIHRNYEVRNFYAKVYVITGVNKHSMFILLVVV